MAVKHFLRIKICGITCTEDAIASEKLGADAVGFILYPKSPRYIEPERISEITAQLGPFISKVGVFVNDEPGRIREICARTGLTTVQLHGDESPEVCESLSSLNVIKAFRVDVGFDPSVLGYYPDETTFLLDTFVPGAGRGGTGKVFDWKIARSCTEYGRIILAGGINPANIVEAYRTVRPYGIDVSSGVETSPGVKDHSALTALFTAAMECDQ